MREERTAHPLLKRKKPISALAGNRSALSQPHEGLSMPKNTPSDPEVNTPAGGPPTSGGGALAVPLPCLYSNNGIRGTPGTCQELQTVLNLCSLLSPYHKRQAETLHLNVHRLVTKVAPSPGHVGFLTITTPDVTDNDELRERWRSFNSNFLAPHPDFGEWVSTKEVQKRGAWHLHLIIVLSQDIREGVDFDQVAKGNYTSASPFLRRIWKELREALPLYGFGRSELLPVKSNADGIARYVGKYISKHIGTRAEEHKGVRLISYSTGWERNSIRFAWNTENSHEWRRKVEIFAEHHGCTEIYHLSAKFGSNWAYKYAQDIYEADSLAGEKIFNESHGKRVSEYKDATITRAETRKQSREKHCIRKLVIHTKRKDYTKDKRKAAQAKKDIGEWMESQKEIEVESSVVHSQCQMEDGMLVLRTGPRAGEFLF